MENKPSIKKNYIYNTLYQLLTLITPLITAPYISRVLRPEGAGIYSYTNSIVTYFTLFAALGTASYGQREIAMHRDDKQQTTKLFWEIEILSVTTTGAALGAWLVWIALSTQYMVYYGVLTISVVAVAFDISWYFDGLEKFKYIVIRNTIVKIAGIVLLFLFVTKETDVLLYVGIMAATGLLGNISMWTYLPGMLGKVDFKSLHPYKVHLKQTFAYFIPTIATSVYTVLDKTMIGAITVSKAENGYYEQATKIVRMLESLLFSLNTVMVSRQSYLFAEGKIDEIKDKINKSFDFLFALAIPIMFGLTAVARNFVPWFFGRGYEPVVNLLRVMSPLPLVICISNILGSQYLTPSGQRARSSKGIVTGAVVNFILNSLLIPKYGADGAAAASVIAELVISIIYMHMSKGYASWKQLGRIAWKKFAASMVMFAVIWVIARGKEGSVLITLVQIAVAVPVYAGMLILLRDPVVDEGKRMLKTGKKNHG
ncbi:MAG: flippase [Eubacteriales bacterium]|jgi:O-antigen/teichoic acid export membrane protein